MTKEISNSDDYIDVRDIITRYEELETAHTPTHDMEESEIEELKQLTQLLNDLKGNGGDEQWRGDWYPVTLIRDSYFEEAMDHLLEDIGDLPKDIPTYLKITVDYTALQMDYTSVEFDGVTYWCR